MITNKKIPLIIGIVWILLTIFPKTGFTLPTLQLDISGGWYDTTTETITASNSTFNLYAILKSKEHKEKHKDDFLANTYYISAAVSPKTSERTRGLGSFSFAGTTIDATDDMTYGSPPLEDLEDFDAKDLSKHSIFPTYFSEFSFTFDALLKTDCYNTQENPGGVSPDPNGDCYYIDFEIDTSLLDAGYTLHFDLYNTKVKNKTGDIDINDFAPFSHDAQSQTAPVPEPGTLLLLASGVFGLGGLRIRKRFALLK